MRVVSWVSSCALEHTVTVFVVTDRARILAWRRPHPWYVTLVSGGDGKVGRC